MKKFVLALSAGALALGAGAFAYAQAGQPGGGPVGDLTLAQVQAKADAEFAKLDVNHDGVINQADRDAMRAARKTEMFAEIDTNHDGSISKDEFMAAKGPHGDRGPGMGQPGMGQPGMGQPGMGGPGGQGMRGPGKRGHGMRGGRGGHGGMGMMMLRMADANNDGSVTRAEFDAAVKTHFAQVDTNHDGKVTKAERQAFHAQMRGKMGQRWKNRAGMPGGDMPPPPPQGDED